MAKVGALGSKLLAWPIIIGAMVVALAIYFENQENGSYGIGDVASVLGGIGIGFIALTLL